jgi:putative aldouronate transport system substrate-binding protein
MKTKLLLILFSVLLISGCGKSKSDETVGTAENPYTIVWYSFGSPQKDLQEVIEKVNEYTRAKIGVVVDLKLDIGNYDKKMKIKMASGEPFDLCFTSSWANNYKSAVSKGYFLPLNDLFNKYGKEMLDVINPIFIAIQ